MLDVFMDDYSETDIPLSSTTDIFHCPVFESGVRKVQSGDFCSVTHEERATFQHFEVSTDAATAEMGDSESYACCASSGHVDIHLYLL